MFLDSTNQFSIDMMGKGPIDLESTIITYRVLVL